MATLTEQIEAMRIRMNELAATEPEFVRTLGEVLASADQQLIEEVGSAAAAHEVRRSAIIRALQMLAGRMFARCWPQVPFVALQDRLQEEPSQARPAMRAGDWRLAASNIHEL
jgi:hypothetical protein